MFQVAKLLKLRQPERHRPFKFERRIRSTDLNAQKMNPSKQCLTVANKRSILDHNQRLFKRAQTGIFHGRIIRFGNNVPEMGNRTRRTWMPNIRSKNLKSDILER